MKRITIFIMLVAFMAGSASALSVKKKSIRMVGTQQVTAAPVTDFEQAVNAYSDDDLSTALTAINRYLKSHPNDAYGLTCLAAIQSDMGNTHQALQAIDKARSGRIEADNNYMNNWMYFTQSTVHIQAKDTISAIEDLNMALKYDNKDTFSYLRRANMFKRMRRYDEAMVDYGYLVQLDPNEVEGYLGLGTVAGSLNKRKDAIKAYTMAIKLEPDNPEPYALRAVEYYNDWDYGKAAKDVISALELDKDNRRAIWILKYLKRDAYTDTEKEFKNKAKKTKDNSWIEILNDLVIE